MFEVYKSLRNNLRKYELVEALIASHRFIQYLYFDIDLPPSLAPPRHLSKIDKMRMGLVQWEFEILIREIILNCSPKVGKKLNNWSEVADKINRIKSIENEVWGGSEDRQNDILYELGSRLIQSQNAMAVARATPDRKLAASLS